MKLRLEPARLRGEAALPPSKSQLHRLLLLSTLRPLKLKGVALPLCRDTEAMLSVVGCMGVQGERTPDGLKLTPGGDLGKSCQVGECAAALRLSLPVFAGRGQEIRFEMAPVLFHRCGDGLARFCREMGLEWTLREGGAQVRGSLPPGTLTHCCNGTSQLASGLLLALAGSGRTLVLPGEIPSRPYVDMTLETLRQAGFHPEEPEPGVFFLPRERPEGTRMLSPEPDASAGAVFHCMNALGGEIRFDQPEKTLQGDGVFSRYCQGDEPIHLNCDAIPDIAPLLALLCTRRPGVSRLTGLRRLHLKECDRFTAVPEMLNALGAQVIPREEGWEIHGGTPLVGGVSLDCRGDHRMALLAAAASVGLEEPILLSGAESVSKSWPGFWETYQALGGKVQWQADSEEC